MIMKSLGTILRKAIEESGYSIYKVANKSGANRTTLQKILSDERPISADMLHNILAVLRLSPAEESEVFTAYEISQSGENLYILRQMTRQFLTNLSNADCFFCQQKPVPTEDAPIPASSANICEQKLLATPYQIEALLGSLIEQESRKTEPGICISLPGTLPLLYDFLFRSLSSKPLTEQFKIRHIIQFLGSPNIEKDALANLNILSKLLPFSLFTSLDYQLQYFYDSQSAPASLNLAFPYYILFSDTLLLLSSDGNMALPCTDTATVLHFKYLFEELSRTAMPLIEQENSAGKFLDHLLEIDTKNLAFHTIEHQPCLVTFLTEEEISRYARKDLPQREALIQMLLLRCRQLTGFDNRCCIFSKSGLLDFASTGMMTDLPASYVMPLTVQDRILILERMYAYMETERQAFYLANPVTFPLPSRLTCIIRSNIGVEFCYYNQDLMGFRRIHIREHTILDTFEDFFEYALQKPIVCSREETMLEISRCIGDLNRCL